VGDGSEPVADTGLRWFNPDGIPQTDQDWGNSSAHSFAVVFPGQPSALVLLNAYWDGVVFTLPARPDGGWTIKVDTNQEDGAPASSPAPLAAGATVTVGGRSLVVALSG
jgi:glycogen operon protein